MEIWKYRWDFEREPKFPNFPIFRGIDSDGVHAKFSGRVRLQLRESISAFRTFHPDFQTSRFYSCHVLILQAR